MVLLSRAPRVAAAAASWSRKALLPARVARRTMGGGGHGPIKLYEPAGYHEERRPPPPGMRQRMSNTERIAYGGLGLTVALVVLFTKFWPDSTNSAYVKRRAVEYLHRVPEFYAFIDDDCDCV